MIYPLCIAQSPGWVPPRAPSSDRAGSPDNRAARPRVGHRRRRHERERGARQARQAQEGGMLHTYVCYVVLSGLFSSPAGCVRWEARKIESLDRQFRPCEVFSVFAGGG